MVIVPRCFAEVNNSRLRKFRYLAQNPIRPRERMSIRFGKHMIRVAESMPLIVKKNSGFRGSTDTVIECLLSGPPERFSTVC